MIVFLSFKCIIIVCNYKHGVNNEKVILLSLTATIMALGFASCNLCSHANLYSKVIKPVTWQEDGKIQFYCADCGKKAFTQVLDHGSFAEHKSVGKTDVDAQTIFVYTHFKVL